MSQKYTNYNILPVGGLQHGETIDRMIDCGKCPAACCREGVVIELSEHERQTLESAGALLKEVRPAEEQTRKRRLFGRAATIEVPGLYKLQADCPFLADDMSCAVYDQPDVRPEVCGELRTGSYRCITIQQARIDSGEDDYGQEHVANNRS